MSKTVTASGAAAGALAQSAAPVRIAIGGGIAVQRNKGGRSGK